MKTRIIYDSPEVVIEDIELTGVLCTSDRGANQDYEDDAYEYELK